MKLAEPHTKEELKVIAEEILDLLAQKELAIWQVKEVLATASRLAENAPMR